MVGTVTISLEDFESLKAESTSGATVKANILKAAKELEVFISFLSTREGMMDHIEEFNSYSKTCRIHIVDGRAKIEIIEEPNEKV